MARKTIPTSKPVVADMYERWTLDCIIEVAQAITTNFVERPQQYRNVPENIANIIQDLWYRSATDPQFPDMTKRQMIFEPILGPSDSKPGPHTSQFHMDGAALRERSRAFTERQVETGEDNLRRAFLDTAVTLRSYLETLVENRVVTIGDKQTKNIFDNATQVLLDITIAGVFGRPPSSVANWPLVGSFDDNGARLIEEATAALGTSSGPISQSKFIVFQRIAHFGAETIRGVLAANLSPTTSEDIDPLIQVTYRWKTALDELSTAP